MKVASLIWAPKVPEGKIFSGKKAEAVIDSWKVEQQLVLKKQGSFLSTAKVTENRLRSLKVEIGKTAVDVRKAHGQYMKCTTPQSRARWARRLLLANEVHTYVRKSHQRLELTVERVKDAIEDGKLVVRLINNQIKDAQLYYEINGQVKLMGQSLAAARKPHPLPNVEYQVLEYNMEQVEKSITNRTDQEVIEHAELLLKEMNEETK